MQEHNNAVLTFKMNYAVYLVDETIHSTLCYHLWSNLFSLCKGTEGTHVNYITYTYNSHLQYIRPWHQDTTDIELCTDTTSDIEVPVENLPTTMTIADCITELISSNSNLFLRNTIYIFVL